MSVDILVFDPAAAPQTRVAFSQWIDAQTDLDPDLDHDDPAMATPALAAWFHEMRQTLPALNGPFGIDSLPKPPDPHDLWVGDYSINRHIIMLSLPWEVANRADDLTRRLAHEHGLGVVDLSRDMIRDDQAVWWPQTPETWAAPPRAAASPQELRASPWYAVGRAVRWVIRAVRGSRK